MELMREFPDKHFDLAIVDPPYGIGESDSRNDSRGTSSAKWKRAKPTNYGKYTWDKEAPQQSYFTELKRVSRNQIIWGANHFIESIPCANSSCWIVWDKLNSGDFADAELAWASFKTAVRKVNLLWNGFIRCETAPRIHPTQKPVALYRWLLANYAKEGQKILDTHLGSGSHAIACHYAKMHLTACELDPDYYAAACERIERETRQLTFL
jgi:site-specific DNA-methyltransferase (adenine-specific)